MKSPHLLSQHIRPENTDLKHNSTQPLAEGQDPPAQGLSPTLLRTHRAKITLLQSPSYSLSPSSPTLIPISSPSRLSLQHLSSSNSYIPRSLPLPLLPFLHTTFLQIAPHSLPSPRSPSQKHRISTGALSAAKGPLRGINMLERESHCSEGGNSILRWEE